MQRPRIGEANLGALTGAVVGATGGLFALGIAAAILNRDPARLFATPTLGVAGFVISGLIGWLLGGQLGPRLEGLLGERNGGIIGGVIGGLLPVTAIALLGWYLVTPH
jgi:hypothetical protein